MQSNSMIPDKEGGWCGVIFVQKSLEGEPRLRHLKIEHEASMNKRGVVSMWPERVVI